MAIFIKEFTPIAIAFRVKDFEAMAEYHVRLFLLPDFVTERREDFPIIGAMVELIFAIITTPLPLFLKPFVNDVVAIILLPFHNLKFKFLTDIILKFINYLLNFYI